MAPWAKEPTWWKENWLHRYPPIPTVYGMCAPFSAYINVESIHLKMRVLLWDPGWLQTFSPPASIAHYTHTRCWDHSCVWSGQLLPYPPVFMCSFTVPILSSTLFFLRCSIQKTVWREPRDHCPQSEEGISCQRQAAWGSCRRRERLCPGSTGGISCEGQVVKDGICPMDPSHIPWVHSGRYSLFLPLLSRQHGLQAGRLGSGNWGPYSLCTYNLAVSLVLGLLCLVSGIW